MSKDDMRRTVAVTVASMAMIVGGWVVALALGWLISWLPDVLQAGFAAVGGVGLLAGCAVGWWLVFSWVEARL